ncbi:ribosome biosynthesis protein LTO1 [Sporobolomyces koalae]|uniref:ribosome biosynthesis protein LTO1 n=1 Tax=Sporobolomyces koalae TaxID=500713 RepID=UPI00318169AF
MSNHTSDFDSLLDLESQFYAAGYDSGLPHGKLHGLFEGRELGREKSWELWEEIGYYEGMARLWKVILTKQGKGSTRSMQALDQILALAAAFPASNDSSLLESASDSDQLDITAQLTTLRAKYKTVCATLGVRSRMAVSSGSGTTSSSAEGNDLKQMGMSL